MNVPSTKVPTIQAWLKQCINDTLSHCVVQNNAICLLYLNSSHFSTGVQCVWSVRFLVSVLRITPMVSFEKTLSGILIDWLTVYPLQLSPQKSYVGLNKVLLIWAYQILKETISFIFKYHNSYEKDHTTKLRVCQISTDWL